MNFEIREFPTLPSIAMYRGHVRGIQIEKGIEQMSDTIKNTENSKKSPVQWPSQPIDKDIHINCGTSDCCQQCEPEKDKE